MKTLIYEIGVIDKQGNKHPVNFKKGLLNVNYIVRFATINLSGLSLVFFLVFPYPFIAVGKGFAFLGI